MSRDVELDNVTMAFGDTLAVRDVSLRIDKGEFFSFLGPSGCGKTTILRLISGFVEPTGGAVRIGGADMRGIGPNRRPTALIFQNLALFPLMAVWENIAFGLEVRGVPRRQRREKAEALLDLIALPGFAERRVSELSGGQRQRVAIARALAVEPAVLLLDEPLSALDLKLRQHMRAELRALQRKTGVTFIYITHDQGEALTMSDRVAVMSQGIVEQVGTSDEIYNEPRSAFVAAFVGEANAFTGRIVAAADGRAVVEGPFGRVRARNPQRLAVGAPATAFVRPERCRPANGVAAWDNDLEATVERTDFEGAFVNVVGRQSGGQTIVLHLPNDGGRRPDLASGRPLRVGFAAADAVVLPPEA